VENGDDVRPPEGHIALLTHDGRVVANLHLLPEPRSAAGSPNAIAQRIDDGSRREPNDADGAVAETTGPSVADGKAVVGHIETDRGMAARKRARLRAGLEIVEIRAADPADRHEIAV